MNGRSYVFAQGERRAAEHEPEPEPQPPRTGKPSLDDPDYKFWRQLPTETMLQIAFRMIDADGNGVLVRRELLESSFGEQLGRLWKDLDKDSDAHVTREEWDGFFEHLRDRALKKLGDA